MAKKQPSQREQGTFHVPKLTEEEAKILQSDNEALRNMCMLNIFDKSLPAIPKAYLFKMADRRMIEASHQLAYEMNGGPAWEALWASENPTEFFKIRARLLPEAKTQQQAVQINIQSNVPRNDLDNVNIVNGQVIDTTDWDDEIPE